MKKLLTFVISLFFITAFSQENQVVEKQYFLENPLTGIIIDGAFDVDYSIGNTETITVISAPETASSIQVKSISKDDGSIYVKIWRESQSSATEMNDFKKEKLLIESRDLSYVELSGTASFYTDTLHSDEITVKTQGSSSANINGSFKNIIIDASGASECSFTGTSENVTVNGSGVSDIDISQLQYMQSTVNGLDVAHIIINQNCNNNILTSNVSTIDIEKKAQQNQQGIVEMLVERNIAIKSVEGNDSIVLHIIDRRTETNNDGSETFVIGPYEISVKGTNKNFTRIGKFRKNKFNGHWGGLDLGINGYNTADFNMDFPAEYEYMNLRFPKSMAFYLNLIEYNIGLSKTQKWGMLSGLGFEWHNYRFSHNTWLKADGGTLQGYYIKGSDVKKTKLMVAYMTIPLIFEYQTNNKSRNNSFHIGAGVVGGLRIGAHTKAKFKNSNSSFYLTDPITGATVSDQYTSKNKKMKADDDFYLNPVKLDATVRLGWGRINLFATYSLTQMFRENHGPELYPWSAGITLLGW